MRLYTSHWWLIVNLSEYWLSPLLYSFGQNWWWVGSLRLSRNPPTWTTKMVPQPLGAVGLTTCGRKFLGLPTTLTGPLVRVDTCLGGKTSCKPSQAPRKDQFVSKAEVLHAGVNYVDFKGKQAAPPIGTTSIVIQIPSHLSINPVKSQPTDLFLERVATKRQSWWYQGNHQPIPLFRMIGHLLLLVAPSSFFGSSKITQQNQNGSMSDLESQQFPWRFAR